MILGLTGFYCSGKSTVEKILAEDYGLFILDMDKIGHEVLTWELPKEQLIAYFGEQILNENREIDRKKLGNIVFSDPEKLKFLNSTVHPWITQHLEKLIQRHQDQSIVISAALLLDAGLHHYCDKILVVNSFLWKILTRARKRDGYSWKRIFHILKNQKLKDYLNQAKNNVDIIYIANNGTKDRLKNQIKQKLQINNGE